MKCISENWQICLWHNSRAFVWTCIQWTWFTLSLGISRILRSSVTVPTTTAVLLSRPGFFIRRTLKWQYCINIHVYKVVYIVISKSSSLVWIMAYSFFWWSSEGHGFKRIINFTLQKAQDLSFFLWLIFHEGFYSRPLTKENNFNGEK